LTGSGNVKFYYSIVISVCDSDQHADDSGKMDQDFIRLEARSIKNTVQRSPPAASGSSSDSVILDLHTKIALIGRIDLDVTLGFLRLEEESVNGYIDLYVVDRDLSSESGSASEIGKDSLYRFKDSWVFFALLSASNVRKPVIAPLRRLIMHAIYLH
jgi:hypothetical protein